MFRANIYETRDQAFLALGEMRKRRETLGEDAGAETVEGDPDRLEQALQNLAANALRHTPDGGVITLSATIENGALAERLSNHAQFAPPEGFVLESGKSCCAPRPGRTARATTRWV